MHPIKKYHVVFRDGENWFQRLFLKKGFGHIFLIQDIDSGERIVIDPLPEFLNIESMGRSDVNIDAVMKELSKTIECKYIEVKVRKNFLKKQRFKVIPALVPRFVSCVGIIKYILGIKCRALTPYGLYKRLLERGDWT